MERFSRQPTNQPAPAPAPAPHHSATGGITSSVKSLVQPSGASKLLVILVIVAALSVTLAFGVSALGALRNTSLVMDDRYQAVFLDNGQVYFGRLSGVNNEYLKLTDIFYLQVEQQIQPDQEKASGNTGDSADQTQIRLAKLGNELHGPEDTMYVLRSKVVFWENLKNDGDVVEAITTFKNGGGNTTNNNDSTNQTSPSNSDESNNSSESTNIEADTSNP